MVTEAAVLGGGGGGRCGAGRQSEALLTKLFSYL